MDGFHPIIFKELKDYVYRLIDPRNGETFYVGRGTKNRLFDHIKDALGGQGDEVSDKLKRIRDIRKCGFNVSHIVHRHGLTTHEAKEVEAALIDAYPGLTNIMGGEGSASRGVMHAKEINQAYLSSPAEIKHKATLLSVNQSASNSSLYEAARYAWVVSLPRAKKAEIVLVCEKGVICEVLIPERWESATSENFPGRENCPGRFGFYGGVAPSEVKALYLNKRVPEKFRFGASNPVRYTYSR